MAIKIYIDQGHNPRNPNSGAEGNGYREQDITYTVGTELAALLNSDPNFEVLTSRKTPTEILGTSNAESLRTRVDEANNWGADYFISIHTNASVISGAEGTEGYVYSFNSPARAFSQSIVDEISRASGFPNRGVFENPSFYVLRKTRMPATLMELGFITNKEEADLMAGNPQLFANAIYRGILNYFGLT